MIGYNYMFAIIAIANILSILIYIAIGQKHPSSLTYRLKMQSKLPFKRVVCSEAISLAYLLASQGAAFTSFKLTAFDSRCPSKGLFLYFPFAPFFSFVLFNASCSAFENGFAYSFTLNLSIA